MPSDAGSQLKSLSVFLGKCHENMHGTAEVILKRNSNIPADANAVSVLVADLDKFSEEGMQISACVPILTCFVYHVSCAEKDILLLSRKRNICFFFILINNHVQCPEADSVQLGFLPREVAKWVSPLSDMGFFNFSGFIYPREALEAAFGVTSTKVQLLLYVSKVWQEGLRCLLISLQYFQKLMLILNPVYEMQGPEFSQMSGLIRDEHLPSLCSLVASLKKSLGLWRLEEVLNQTKVWYSVIEITIPYYLLN
jgi:hypothetical protein